jgi:hypothetical protein
MARKLYTFPDKNLDRQVIELVLAINSIAPTPTSGIIVPDLTTGLTYALTVEIHAGVAQLVMTQL